MKSENYKETIYNLDMDLWIILGEVGAKLKAHVYVQIT